MRYANHANPLEREAAWGAVQQHIARPNPPIIAANMEGQNVVNGNVNVPPPDLEDEYDENDTLWMVLFLKKLANSIMLSPVQTTQKQVNKQGDHIMHWLGKMLKR